MKKIIIFLAVIIILFGALAFVSKMQNEKKMAGGNPYDKDTLDPATISQLDDPNYQNLVLPEKLEEMIASKEDVTVYFYSPTCSHCQRTTPVVSPLAKEMNLDLLQFNLLEYEEGWDQYGIEQTPTIVQYKKGEEVNRISGYREKEVFEKWFNENSK
ncbi:thioredoxin family protein [Cytobacillus sp. FJAT-53684]|uniref:Thioredoxin family protein n=1 Tax=Cytobacillus mangrovibacter TaxID=3299024 RepID=A0ABW6JWH6_9BACI